jgi:hypothetical protein
MFPLAKQPGKGGRNMFFTSKTEYPWTKGRIRVAALIGWHADNDNRRTCLPLCAWRIYSGLRNGQIGKEA